MRLISTLLLLSTTTAAQASTPAKTLSFALATEPPQLNSMKATDTQSMFVLGHVMEGLTRYGKEGELLPGVAESWKIGDAKAIFHLRKNAKWSDGKQVTAQDFVFAWKTALDPKTASEYAFILFPLKNAEKINQGGLPGSALGVIAKDAQTLEITFEKPCGYFLSLTAFATYLPVREDIYRARGEKFAAEATDMVYDGPFTLTKWVHGAALTMDKNANYWNAAKVALDRIDIPYITPDNSARFNFFKDGKVDLLETLNKDDLQKAQAERMKMKNFADGTLLFLEFNFRAGKATANKHLRQAIAAAFNADEYVSRVVGIPGTKPGRGLIPAWLKGAGALFRAEHPLAAHKADIAAAKKHIEAAKKELGGSIPPLTWLTGDTPLAAKEAEYFQNLFKSALGIDLRIDKQIFKQRLAKMTDGAFDIVSGGWGPDYADPMTFSDLWASWNENNRGKWINADYDKLIRAAQATSNPKARMEAMAAAEKIGLDDLVVLPLYERTIVYLTDGKVENIIRHAVGPDPDFTQARMTAAK